ncbi:hypothetical protein AB1388_16970 [Streptomyces hydrogenans]|uniref:hypothetical protein n=1 Tax=Streptomyces hydrogenans TaxID=1873719 RepID=UPI00345CBBB0
MTTGDGWTAAVRDRLAPGRLLPLGAVAGAWLAERAAREVLDRAASGVPGVVPGALRIGAAAEATVPDPPFPVPPGGLAPGPLRIDAEFAVVAAGRPLPETAEELRAVLLVAAAELGLAVTEADLRMTDLLEEAPATEPPPAPPGHASPETDDPVALAVLLVPGVAAVTAAVGPPVHRAGEAVRVEFAVSAEHPPAEVARAAHEAAAAAAPEGAAVTVLVTEVR